jgi:predicted hotdog family 3-hydroxylacyl-ACP dehydratase
VIAGRAQIEALIPHAGRMCLLDELLGYGPEHIQCLARSHLATDNPLRVQDRLAGVCGIEYAAQAMALHGRLTSQAATPRAGFLASVRELTCHVARLDEIRADLLIDAQRLMGEESRVVYAFSLSAGGTLLLEGRAAVILEP